MARIYGKRIMLREYITSDIESIRGWVNDHETTRMLDPSIFSYPHPYEKTKAFVDSNIENGGPAFIIANIETGEYIGQIDLMNINYRNRSAEIGIVIGIKRYRSLGYGSEAIKLLLEFAFNQLNLNRIEIRVFSFNEQGIRCYKKCGFIEEGCLRQAIYIDGEYHDIIILSVLREEFDRME